MALVGDDAALVSKIQETYVPFLKKLISFLEKTKKATPDNLNKLNAIYKIFTTAPPQEQVETFHANQKKLENWYNKTQKDKQYGEARGTKRSLVSISDTDSSQGPCDSSSVPAKRSTFSDSLHSSNSNQNVKSPASQIKKETAIIDPKPIAPKPVETPAALPSVAAPQPAAEKGPITFTCASCQFQTLDEGDFMKHARTDHRTDLSMWCKQCGKCFSNAGVLVSHIKERDCTKEEMIYRCGVKDCVFETVSGQTFVHHLRHCHKGSPFIFCVHCQKIFTLPHCLILHMQDDCPFKHKNRRKPGTNEPIEEPPPAPLHNLNNSSSSVANKNTNSAAVNSINISSINKTPSNISSPIISNAVTPAAGQPRAITPVILNSSGRGSRGGRGRGARGRGRGRGRIHISDSSDSDDPDDPSWRPEEVLPEGGLRRSGRWAKKVNDVMNPEPSTSGVSTPSSKSFAFTEVNTKMLNCPCCEFMAAFQSVLEDHYIATHKVPNKNACAVCNLKFESSALFIEHFKDHIRGVLPNKPVNESVAAAAPKVGPVSAPKLAPAPASKLAAALVPTPTLASAPVTANPEPVSVTNPEPVSTAISSDKVSVDASAYDEIIGPINEVNLAKPKENTSGPVRIPYQAAIHHKNMKDSKLKRFEELKSPFDLKCMKTAEKLVHFFKCSLYNCPYTTNSRAEFIDHYSRFHTGKRFHCCYCLKEFFMGDSLSNHMLSTHNDRLFQCSICFYRACSEMHVKIHIKNAHPNEAVDILMCTEVPIPEEVKSLTSENANEVLDTTWPFICAIGPCDYSTYDPKEFKEHNDNSHRTINLFYCHYCKVDFISLKRLMNHYRLHGINVFQCNYCIHGSETKEDIMLHLCNNHADRPLKASMRGSFNDIAANIKSMNVSIIEEHAQKIVVKPTVPSPSPVPSPVSDKAEISSDSNVCQTNLENEFYHVMNGNYPKYLQNLYSDIVCGIPFCSARSKTFQEYFDHLKGIHNAVNYPCPYCPETSDIWEDFKKHLLCHSTKLYACGSFECNMYDTDKDKVKEYTKHHANSNVGVVIVRELMDTTAGFEDLPSSPPFTLPENYYTCLFCNYKCSDRNTMKNHMYEEMGYKRFSCLMCNQKCLSRKELRDHFVSSHNDSDVTFSLEKNAELESLVKRMLASGVSVSNMTLPTSCDLCNKKFSTSAQMQTHLYICIQKKYRPYECCYCKKYFLNVLAMKYHTDAEHSSQSMAFSVFCNSVIESHIGKKLMKCRLKHLKEFFEQNLVNAVAVEVGDSVKVYSCSLCSFEADHKYNIHRHAKTSHSDQSASAMKTLRSSDEWSDLNSGKDENSNDDAFKKRYQCGICMRKFAVLRAMVKHFQDTHAGSKDSFYYFIPDKNCEFSSSSDTNVFECGYCKSLKENLFSLKKHSDLMHYGMEFKVKGYPPQSPKSYLACAYCYKKVDTIPVLKLHSASVHPSEIVKYLGEPISNKVKRIESSDDLPNKRVKFTVTVFVCLHCGGAYPSEEQVTAHAKKSHSRLKSLFKTINQSANEVEFFMCEFCSFTSEKEFLDKHLNCKHKMRVTCSYCSKRFEFASKLKEHHEISHKDLPMKFVQETLGSAVPRRFDPSTDDEKSCESTDSIIIPEVPEFVSHYGKKPDPVDLDSLLVCMETEEGQYSKLPASDLMQRFNIFPSVVLEDALKKIIFKN